MVLSVPMIGAAIRHDHSAYRWVMSLGALALDPEVEIQPWTRELYDALVTTGRLDGVPVELLEGELVTMSPQGEPHASAVDNLAWHLQRALFQRYGEAYRVRQEKPFAASDRSEPEPDIAVIDAAAAAWGAGHPTRAHLIVEVAESSRRVDLRHKPRIYAGAEVPLYWVLDLSRSQVVVHTDPAADLGPGYATVQTLPLTTELTVLGIDVVLADLLR